jgi:hypothetical protein
LPVIFPDEPKVAQDLNNGDIWRRKGKFLLEASHEQEQYPIVVVVRAPSLRNFGALYFVALATLKQRGTSRYSRMHASLAA